MSEFEHLFFQSGLTPERAAKVLADTFGWTVTEHDHGVSVTARVDGFDGVFGGGVDVNYFAEEPGDEDHTPSGHDQYPVMWSVFLSGPDKGAANQRAGARALFLQVVERLRWPALLVHDVHEAVAVWDHEHGLVDFPEGTDVSDQVVLSATPRPS